MHTNIRACATAALAFGLLSACGGGGGGGESTSPPSSAANTPPSIAGLGAELSVAQDTTSAPISFGVTDAQSGGGELKLTAESSNAEVISGDGVAFAGTGDARTLALTPEEGAAGAAVITITVADPQGMTATHALNVMVTTVERSFKEMVGKAFTRPADATPEETTGVRWVDDAESEPAAFDHLIGQ